MSEQNVGEKVNDYYNSVDLDPDLIYLFLWTGKRVPQNEMEKGWKRDSESISKSGKSFELSFN